jgi:hypothetical protein
MYLLGLLAIMGPAWGAPSGETLESWMDSVVLLTTGPALCAGVMLEEEGLVATAYHCVAIGRKSKVESRSGEVRHGKTIAALPKDDLALVRIEPFDDWKGREIRTDAPSLGESVWALGHPFGFTPEMVPALEGLLRWSVSRGVVSAVGTTLIQVDAPLNPGNSGGPVLDADGRIVGIASRKLRGEGLSFLAPASTLAKMVSSPDPMGWLGGQYGLVLGAQMPMDMDWVSSLGVGARVSVRDRLVATAVLGFPLGSRWQALSQGSARWMAWESTACLRVRVGRGRWSSTAEAGGVLLGSQGRMSTVDAEGIREFWDWPKIHAGVTAGINVGGSTISVRYLPEESLTSLVVEANFGGVLGTF